jgi:hypothetical protein
MATTTVTLEIETPHILDGEEKEALQDDIENALFDGLQKSNWRIEDVRVVEMGDSK